MLYELIFRRTTTTGIAMVFGAVVFQSVLDPLVDGYFYSLNKGKLYKDLPPRPTDE
eukprot:m.165255 g.165255  ORF g.165255 m.165255 type:complete len:56 (-) comp12536_c0_seq1:138-305(-)